MCIRTHKTSCKLLQNMQQSKFQHIEGLAGHPFLGKVIRLAPKVTVIFTGSNCQIKVT